jgi:hypothetical protein
MTEQPPQTFANQVLHFAESVDILPPHIYADLLREIETYLRTELNARFFSITTQKNDDDPPFLEGEWPTKDWWGKPVKENGQYTCQTAFAHDRRRAVWIVGKNHDRLDETIGYEDLLQNVSSGVIPRYAQIENTISRTSIILPLIESGRHFGVMNVESEEYLPLINSWRTELEVLARSISILRQLKNTYTFQTENTENAKRRLLDGKGDFLRVTRERKLFFIFSSETDQEFIDLVEGILKSCATQEEFLVRKWTELAHGRIMENIWREITTCLYALCYLSESEGGVGSSRFVDNPNVLFEAGMIHALLQSKRGPIQGMVLLREKNAPAIPFDLSGEYVVAVNRGNDGKVDEGRLRDDLSKTVEQMIGRGRRK